MLLKEFIQEFVLPDTLVRIWKQEEDQSFTEVESPAMSHYTAVTPYGLREVLGVTDMLLINTEDSEAVNIVIKG